MDVGTNASSQLSVRLPAVTIVNKTPQKVNQSDHQNSENESSLERMPERILSYRGGIMEKRGVSQKVSVWQLMMFDPLVRQMECCLVGEDDLKKLSVGADSNGKDKQGNGKDKQGNGKDKQGNGKDKQGNGKDKDSNGKDSNDHHSEDKNDLILEFKRLMTLNWLKGSHRRKRFELYRLKVFQTLQDRQLLFQDPKDIPSEDEKTKLSDEIDRLRLLQNSKILVKSVHDFFESLNSFGIHDFRIHRGEYKELWRLIYKVLVPFDDNVEDCIDHDWSVDTGETNELTFNGFFQSMFELADCWCETVSEDEYSSFIQSLHSECVRLNSSIPFGSKKLILKHPNKRKSASVQQFEAIMDHHLQGPRHRLSSSEKIEFIKLKDAQSPPKPKPSSPPNKKYLPPSLRTKRKKRTKSARPAPSVRKSLRKFSSLKPTTFEYNSSRSLATTRKPESARPHSWAAQRRLLSLHNTRNSQEVVQKSNRNLRRRIQSARPRYLERSQAKRPTPSTTLETVILNQMRSSNRVEYPKSYVHLCNFMEMERR